MVTGIKDRHIGQGNRIGISEINPCINIQLISTRVLRTYILYVWGKDSLFNKWYWENWISICKRLKLDAYIIRVQNKLKMDKSLNIRPQTVKLLEENREKAS